MTSRKRPPSPGFLADANGNIFKRYKIGDTSSYFMGDGTEVPGHAPGLVPDASNEAHNTSHDAPNIPLAPSNNTPIPSCNNSAPEPRLSAKQRRAARHRLKTRTSSSTRATPARRLPDTPPTPTGDTRIPIWQEESRAFKGTVAYPKKANGEAQRLARNAQNAALWVDGKPQFNLFVDGSHRKQDNESDKKRGRKRDLEYRAWGPGSYGVIFRNPYHKQGPAELDHVEAITSSWHSLGTSGYDPYMATLYINHNHNGEAHKHPDESEDGLGPGNFNIRYWHSYRVLSSNHAELAALSQGLETVIASLRKHRPPSASVSVFTDSIYALNRLTPRLDGQPGNMRDALTLPLVRVIVWQSHYLADQGCEIKLQWLPRNCVLAHKLADRVAGWWRNEGTMDKPLWRRDVILDTVHEDIVEAVNQIEAQKQAPARLGPNRYGPSKNHQPKAKDTGWGCDILDNFAGSTVQKVIETSALQLPGWTRSSSACRRN